MKPKPLASLNHLTVPLVVDIVVSCLVESNISPFPRASVAGSDAITDEKQDEELRKRFLRERRNGVHSEQRTNKLG
jgi:hypothetical protein